MSAFTAQVIPFPSRAPVAPAAVQPATTTNDPADRLARALASLDAALTEQRAAMAGWRESLDQLRKTTNGLGLNMQRYHRTLGKLGEDVAGLHSQAVRLERWADETLATQTPTQTLAHTLAHPSTGPGTND